MAGEEAPSSTPLGQPVEKVAGGVALEDAEKGKADTWRLEPQPIREDQVENAVKFLSHPKVKSSPIVHRRSFLERKGLSREEIDEAFNRVPDPPSSDSAATAIPSSDMQARDALASSAQAVLPAQQKRGVGQAITPAQQPRGISWGQRLLALGVLTATGACAGVITKMYLLPQFKAWVRSIVLDQGEAEYPPKPSVAVPGFVNQTRLPNEIADNEAAGAATAAAAAAAEVASAMREIAQARIKEGQQLSNIIKALETQTQELKSALSGLRDVVHSPEPTMTKSYRTDVWRTPEIPRPTGMLTDRTYAATVSAPPVVTPNVNIKSSTDE